MQVIQNLTAWKALYFISGTTAEHRAFATASTKTTGEALKAKVSQCYPTFSQQELQAITFHIADLDQFYATTGDLIEEIVRPKFSYLQSHLNELDGKAIYRRALEEVSKDLSPNKLQILRELLYSQTINHEKLLTWVTSLYKYSREISLILASNDKTKKQSMQSKATEIRDIIMDDQVNWKLSKKTKAEKLSRNKMLKEAKTNQPQIVSLAQAIDEAKSQDSALNSFLLSRISHTFPELLLNSRKYKFACLKELNELAESIVLPSKRTAEIEELDL